MRRTGDELKLILENKKFQQCLDSLAKKYAGKRILGYGTGLFTNIILDNYDVSGLNIIGFADSKYLYQQEDFRNYKTFSPDQIEEINPDIILLFVYNDAIIKEFFKDYYPEYKIPLVHVIKRNLIEKIRFFLLES
jgi:ABC-type Fe3+-hydroxamate transport system substrate-binding protein